MKARKLIFPSITGAEISSSLFYSVVFEIQLCPAGADLLGLNHTGGESTFVLRSRLPGQLVWKWMVIQWVLSGKQCQG